MISHAIAHDMLFVGFPCKPVSILGEELQTVLQFVFSVLEGNVEFADSFSAAPDSLRVYCLVGTSGF